MNNMRECPFCGNDELIKCDKDNDRPAENWAVWCGNCGAIGPNDLGWSGAVEMWNLRRPYTKLEEEKIALELAVRDLEQLKLDELEE